MKKHFLALGAITTLFFACSGGGDKFVGRWIGNMDGKADTFNVTKEGENYTLSHGASKLTGKAMGDSLSVDIGQGMGTVKFGYNNSNGQLSIKVGPTTVNYDKK
jgi:hypothetical protein